MLVPIDRDAFAKSVLTFDYTDGAPEATFTFPGKDGAVIKVCTDGTKLRLFPERSGNHRAILAALNIA